MLMIPYPTILLADDDPSTLQLLGTMLDGLPVRMLYADNGVEAINLVEHQKPALAIIDYQMPGWDGLTVCRRMKEDESLTGIKIVLITGHGAPPFLLEAVNHGIVDAALMKPFSHEEFLTVVTRLLPLGASASTAMSTRR
ncbi:MAG TPA: response regulator [Nitrospirales bacterium]|nr:response regulator [Nitrospirales bacterium]